MNDGKRLVDQGLLRCDPADALVSLTRRICLRLRFLDEACISPFSDDAVIKSIPLARFPPDMYMVVRTLMLLRGLCFNIGLDIQARRPASIAPHATAM